MKKPKQLERYFKGVSNNNRIAILILLSKKKYLSLFEIAESLNRNEKTISEHTRKLVNAGLLNKTYDGREVIHSLSPYGEKFVRFFKTF